MAPKKKTAADDDDGNGKKKPPKRTVQVDQQEPSSSAKHTNDEQPKLTVSRGQQTSRTLEEDGDLRLNYDDPDLSEDDTKYKLWPEASSQLFVDFDDLLPEIGEFGRFQKVMFIFMIPYCFIAAFVYLSQIFMTLQPENYYCFVSELSLIEDEGDRKMLSLPKESDGSYSRCFMYDANYTAIFTAYKAKNYSHFLNESYRKIPCKEGYTFEDDQPFHTATMEFGWICENDFYATYTQMIFFLGSIVGCLGYGHFADHCGRLAALVSSCALALFGSIFTAFTQNFLGFAFTRFIVGASYDTCFTMIYILVLEYVGPTYRTFVANMSLALFYSPLTVLIPWMALYLRNWRTFAIVGSLPNLFALFAFFFLPESARWLVSVGKIDDAIVILQQVSRCNNRPISKSHWQRFRESCEQFYKEEFEGRTFTVVSIFKRSRLARYMILMVIIWMSISLVYDGHVRAASVLDRENVYVVFSIACATEIPGDLLVIVTLDRFGRRWCSFVCTVLSGLFSLIAANISNPMHVLAAALAGRFFANICYNIGLQWAAEVLPTVVRAQGVAFIHTLGFVAMLLSPPVIYLSNLSISLMLNTLGILGIIGGLLALLLPETLHQDLPQTLSDGNEFGKDQRIWHLPCCGPGARRQYRPKPVWHQGSSLRTLSRDEYRSRKLHRVTVVKGNRRSVVPPMRSMVSYVTDISAERMENSYKFESSSRI